MMEFAAHDKGVSVWVFNHVMSFRGEHGDHSNAWNGCLSKTFNKKIN